jgi:predicted  nucleic acid-binding Zn-ribbon protein
MSSEGEEEIPQQDHSFRTNPSILKHTSRKSYDVSDNEQKKIKDVEKSLKDLELKSHEMSRYIESLRNERSRIDDSKFGDFENEKLKQEYATLKSDNIIFREDINRLSDLNRHLEEELSRQRNRK